MSRTDHHTPDWVRGPHSPRREPHHHPRCEDGPTYYGWWRDRYGTAPCNLDDPRPRSRRHGCFWDPADRDRWYCGVSPSREDRRVYYYGPERRAVRDALRAARDEYNTYGDVDTDPPTRQTRRSTWAGGWWE